MHDRNAKKWCGHCRKEGHEEHYCRAKHHPGNKRRFVEITARVNSKNRMIEYREMLGAAYRERVLTCQEETPESEAVNMAELESELREKHRKLPATSETEKAEVSSMYQELERLGGFIARHRAFMSKEEVQSDKKYLEEELDKLEATAIKDKETDVQQSAKAVENDCNEFKRQHTLKAAKEGGSRVRGGGGECGKHDDGRGGGS